jgi:hypothetical protein
VQSGVEHASRDSPVAGVTATPTESATAPAQTKSLGLQKAGHLRDGIKVAQAADVLWTYSAPKLYELLVVRRGWTPKRYGRFVADAMISGLL